VITVTSALKGVLGDFGGGTKEMNEAGPFQTARSIGTIRIEPKRRSTS
jgi:hypothetical protein